MKSRKVLRIVSGALEMNKSHEYSREGWISCAITVVGFPTWEGFSLK